MGFNPGGGSGGASNVSGLSDVTLSNPANTQVLSYDSSVAKWKNANAGSGSSPTLANIPAGSNITVDYSGSAYPARPTARTDIVVIWRGPTQPPAMLNGDEWKVTS